ncbi:MAG: SGNH/GDSL hydrolase family protein, partial [Anaerolineae bacterium]|nr:SGNH/GDSL hydrolase family protein [Anaerolineae bacterium]
VGGAPSAPSEGPPPERVDYPAVYLTNAVIRNARAIYARGRQLGNSPFAFMKIGESNTAGTVYLCNFEWQSYDLGTYAHLQGIVDQFNTTGSFCRFNFTAQNGFATVNVLDPTLAPDDQCQPNQTPLECEYNRSLPSYAFIYIGMADHGILTVREYEQNIITIISWLSRHGVIPILQTYPTSDGFTDGKPQEFNEALRRVARTYNVPLLDLRAALYNYENRGTGSDGYHLSVRDPSTTTFTGDEFVYGRTYRELQSLQILFDLQAIMNN